MFSKVTRGRAVELRNGHVGIRQKALRGPIRSVHGGENVSIVCDRTIPSQAEPTPISCIAPSAVGWEAVAGGLDEFPQSVSAIGYMIWLHLLGKIVRGLSARTGG